MEAAPRCARFTGVLAERELVAGGCVEPAGAVRMGRLLGADVLVFLDTRQPPPLPEKELDGGAAVRPGG
jgi:hypothetical protein